MRRVIRFVFRTVFLSIVLVMVLAVTAVVAVWRELTQDLPPVAELLDYRPPAATRVFAADGTLIGEFFVERRYLVPIDQVPTHVRQAFLASEDTDFYQHRGVDPAGIMRALKANLERGEIVQGASTITQQVVKQLLLSPERSFERKAKELILAVELESKLSKDEILYLYLNHIYFGAGTYGISAAAQVLFGKNVGELSLAQAALLAGLPQAPSRRDPLRRPQAALARQRYVLDRMLAAGFISPAEHDAALAEKIEIKNLRTPMYVAAPWYVAHVRSLLEEEYGAAFADLGLEVHTAVDLGMQEQAEKELREGLRTIDRRLGVRSVLRRLPESRVEHYLARQRETRRPEGPQHAVVSKIGAKGVEIRTPWGPGLVTEEGLAAGGEHRSATSFRRGDVISVDPLDLSEDGLKTFALDPDPLAEGALVAIEPTTGLVKALVGGVDFERSQFNRATLARRQPGSAFKPLIYAAAIDHGFTPTSIVQDAPISLPAGRGKWWSPKNYGGRYRGAVTLRTALAQSINTVSVRLAVSIGVDPLRQYLRIFDFPAVFPRNYSLALGTSEVTPLELTKAYGVFATLGKRFEPVFITSVTNVNGEPVDFPKSHPQFELVMNPATAFVMTQMMGSAVETGTAREARKLGRPSAGKTGTTNDSKDAWFLGFTPELLTGVWIGFDADRSLGTYTGGRAAVPIWTKFMKRALEGRPVTEFAVPENVSLVKVDAATGLRAVAGRASRTEAFVAGTEPKRYAPKPKAKPKPTAAGVPAAAQAAAAAPAARAPAARAPTAGTVATRARAASLPPAPPPAARPPAGQAPAGQAPAARAPAGAPAVRAPAPRAPAPRPPAPRARAGPPAAASLPPPVGSP
jgi:penicillin-binding protein 1A